MSEQWYMEICGETYGNLFNHSVEYAQNLPFYISRALETFGNEREHFMSKVAALLKDEYYKHLKSRIDHVVNDSDGKVRTDLTKDHFHIQYIVSNYSHSIALIYRLNFKDQQIRNLSNQVSELKKEVESLKAKNRALTTELECHPDGKFILGVVKKRFDSGDYKI